MRRTAEEKQQAHRESARRSYWRKKGLEVARPRRSDANTAESIRAQLRTVGTCWVWPGSQDPYGYGRVVLDGRRWLTHRLFWHLAGRELVPGMVLDHSTCPRQDILCCNPDHLEQVTVAENARRGAARRDRSACLKGHPRNAENSWTDSRGYPQCRVCRRARAKARRAR